jgi:signal transduction histidine kinase
MVTAFTQGRKASIAMGIASAIALVGLVIAERMQWISASVARTPEQVMVTYFIIVFIVAAIAIVLAENFKRVLNGGRRLAVKLQDRVEELNLSDQALRKLNEELEQRVFQRTQELQDLVTKLEATQRELVNSEKLASLGAMVAGISHELNTPIGNSLTVASTLQDHFREFAKMSNVGLKKSDLKNFITEGTAAADIVVRSNLRAAELISSFKKVAVDQTSEKRRIFDLLEVINDNLVSIGALLQKHGVTVSVKIPTGIECNSYPGPFGQIFDNLINNAVLHGFDQKSGGQITVEASVVNSVVYLVVSDNGVGMSPQLMSHIFDPFFTTKMGRGGSGLGLFVSHRIATSILGGVLNATSEVGVGSSFQIDFPIVAPFPMSAQ